MEQGRVAQGIEFNGTLMQYNDFLLAQQMRGAVVLNSQRIKKNHYYTLMIIPKDMGAVIV